MSQNKCHHKGAQSSVHKSVLVEIELLVEEDENKFVGKERKEKTGVENLEQKV